MQSARCLPGGEFLDEVFPQPRGHDSGKSFNAEERFGDLSIDAGWKLCMKCPLRNLQEATATEDPLNNGRRAAHPQCGVALPFLQPSAEVGALLARWAGLSLEPASAPPARPFVHHPLCTTGQATHTAPSIWFPNPATLLFFVLRQKSRFWGSCTSSIASRCSCRATGIERRTTRTRREYTTSPWRLHSKHSQAR